MTLTELYLGAIVGQMFVVCFMLGMIWRQGRG